MTLTRHITKAMVDAAYKVLLVETSMPYGARVSDYVNDQGYVDTPRLQAADAAAEAKNKALVRRALVAAAHASVPRGRPHK